MGVALKAVILFVLLLSVLLFFFDKRKGYTYVDTYEEKGDDIWEDEREERAVALED